MHVLYYVTILQFWISFKFTYYYCHVDFFDFFLTIHMAEWGGGRRRVTKGRTMRVRRTRQLKWEEVQDTVCSSRWNFAHVPLSRSLQPGKGRMAWKSRTVEVRFYKESRVLGCEGRGWGVGGRCLLNICISRCRWKNIHRCIYEAARSGEMVSFTLCTLSFLLPPFVFQRLLAFYFPLSCSLYFCLAFFILSLLSSSPWCSRCM